jgi:predicted nucleic acid-binding protein
VSVFVDTNVLVYARDASDPEKQAIAAAWIEHLWASADGRLSVQVLQEYYVTTTRKLDPGLPAEEARQDRLHHGLEIDGLRVANQFRTAVGSLAKARLR